MTENYSLIEPEIAHALLERVKGMQPEKRGVDRRAYLVDDYAVLATDRLKVRNVVVRDDDLAYFDAIIAALAELHGQGVGVVPILGYCCAPDSADGHGFIFERRAKGQELYDDAALSPLQGWTQGNPGVYLKSALDPGEYLLSRTHEVSQIPQKAFDKFVSDILAILRRELLIDFMGQSNFFYSPGAGFQFIDIDSHTDWYYGLTPERTDPRRLAALGAFVPCHFAQDTEIYAPAALVQEALLPLGEQALVRLSADNGTIFLKCRTALEHNDIPENVICDTLKRIKLWSFPHF